MKEQKGEGKGVRGALWKSQTCGQDVGVVERGRCCSVRVGRADVWLHGGDLREASDLTDQLGDADQTTVCLCASAAGPRHPRGVSGPISRHQRQGTYLHQQRWYIIQPQPGGPTTVVSKP